MKIFDSDNTNRWMPIATTLLVIFCIIAGVWFFRGGSFRLYASIFFGLYFMTKQIWLSVLLVAIVQNIVFIPLHLMGDHFSNRVEAFEDKLKETTDDQQYIVFKEQVHKGNLSVIFYILNFVINAIAFLSAGRIFLIDFYNQKLNPHYLYSFIPYPDYPLKGTVFKLPFLHITKTMALDWQVIIYWFFWVLVVMFAIRLLWRIFKPLLSGNKQLLSIRMIRNKFFAWIGGITGTMIIIVLYFFRHVPVNFQYVQLAADLTRQNTTMNTITAIGTFITTIYFGLKQNEKEVSEARTAKIDEMVVQKVSNSNIRNSMRNAIILGLGAFFLTNQIPCAFELSVATFEVLVIAYPFIFSQITKQARL